jgi:hypothetical protein
MAIWALLVVAAVVFSGLAGLIEIRETRRARRRLPERRSVTLHPLVQHSPPRVRYFTLGSMRRHLGLFIGFLVVAYVVVFLLKTVYALLPEW